MMCGIASALLLVLGIAIAWRAERQLAHAERTTAAGQYFGGLLIVAGLTLIGLQLSRALPFIAVFAH